MKSVIGDYFGQSSKENKSDNSVAHPVSNNESDMKSTLAKTGKDAENEVLNSKENVKSDKKPKGHKITKEKSLAPKNGGPSQAQKTQKKKSLSMKKQTTKEGSQQQDDYSGDGKVKSAMTPSFALKIKIKSKEQSDAETFIDEFSSPEHGGVVSGKELKSPPGTMLSYLIPQKNASPCSKEPPALGKAKVNRDIADFFSPSKKTNSDVVNSDQLNMVNKNVGVDPKSIESGCKSKEERESNAEVNTGLSTATTPKPKKKTKSSRGAVFKKDVYESVTTATASGNDANVAQASSRRAKSSQAKTKSAKKSLSLAKTETCKNVEPPVMSEQNQPVAQTMKDAFKDIMSKSMTVSSPSTKSKTAPSKKRKRNEEDDCEGKLPKSFTEDSPLKARKLCKTNQIDSNSDDVSVKPLNFQNSCGSPAPEENSDVISGISDAGHKAEDSKRNNLMNYFAKVTREEVLAKEEKIEMKVKVMIHSPPTTPSKKTKRRSINSLPGGAASASLTKKKGALKNRLKENVNAIEVIDVEDTKGGDRNNKEISKFQSIVNQTKAICEPQTTPQENLTPKSDSPAVKANSACKPARRASAKGNSNQNRSNTASTAIRTDKPDRDVKAVEEDCLAIPLDALSNNSEGKCSDSGVSSPTPWKMRVRVAPVQLPSTQGTLLEEESDCEEIFPIRQEKKRRIERPSRKLGTEQKGAIKEDISITTRSPSPDIIFEKERSSGAKIAPLFTRKAETQARQLFLQSGVPDQVKRALETQRSFDEQEVEIFPKFSHIQQKDDKDWIWNLSSVSIPLKEESLPAVQPSSKFSLSDLTGTCNIKDLIDHINSTSCKGPEMRTICTLPTDIMKPILRLIKQESPDFMVGNTFKALKKKMREEEFAKVAALSAVVEVQKPRRKSVNRKSIVNSKFSPSMGQYRAHVWTEKYKPSTVSEIVGNCASVQQLRRWLEAWRKASEDVSKLSYRDENKRKKKRKEAIDDDDFLVSDNSSDASGSNLPLNIAILSGPNGSGKTSSVYALAKDLGFKVLEVNASEKRNGKLVLSKLSEATQSHQVQQSNTAQQGFAALFSSNLNSTKTKSQKTKEAPKSCNDEEDDKAKKMSLILFEDVDIVFEEEDEGFLSAISNLVSTSKRPVILTTTDPESPLVNRFMNSSSLTLQFSSSPNLISTWLQIVSIIEGIYVAPQAVKDLVSVCQGDFRKALLQMQLWVTSGGNNLSMPTITYPLASRKSKKNSNCDETDDLSDLENDDGSSCSPSIPANTDCLAAMLGTNDTDKNGGNPYIKVPFPLNLGLLWWNIPPLLSLGQVEHAQLPVHKEDPPVSGPRSLLDASFIASFCSEGGSSFDSGVTDESDAACSQGTNSGEPSATPNVEAEKVDESFIPCGVDHASHRICCSQEDMEAMLNQMISISFIDVVSCTSQLSRLSNEEPVLSFSYPVLKDSLSLTKSEEEGPNWVMNSTSQNIVHWLAEQSLNVTRSHLCQQVSQTCSYNHCLPDVEEYRWRGAHRSTKQDALNALPLCVRLDRSAIATDYLPTLRTFCRLERNRSVINTKRRNRFYHYLKSLGAHLTVGQLELLCCTMVTS